MEKSNSAKLPEQKVPHYLRASTGSCHDLCKYGRRHTLGEEETIKSPRKTAARLSLNKLKSEKTITSIEEKMAKATRCEVCARRSLLENPSSGSDPCLAKCKATMDAKTSSPRQTASPGGKTRLLDSSMSGKSDEPRVIVKRSVSLPSEQVQVTRREGNNVDKMTRSRSIKLSSVGLSDMRRNRDTEESASASASASARLSSPKPKTAALSRASKTGAQRSVPPLMGRSKVNPVEKTKQGFNKETSNNESASVEGDPPQPSSPSPVYSLLVDGGVEFGNEADAHTPSALSHKEDDEEVRCNNRNMNWLISDKVQSMVSIPDDFTVPLLQSPPSAKCSSRMTSPSLLSSAEKLSSGNVKTGERQSLKEMHDKSLIQSSTATHYSDGKHRMPSVKLKFRRGTVLHVQPSNSDTPRRLRFRQPQFAFNKAAAQDSVIVKNKSTEEMDNLQPNTQPASEENVKSLRKSRVIDKYHSPVKSFKNQKAVNVESDNQSNRRLRFRMPRMVTYEGALKKAWGMDIPESTGVSSLKLVLKHHEVQKKKDDKGLFNNVIEETASKLVESRKSKVKALVGAFETVISLQELHTR